MAPPSIWPYLWMLGGALSFACMAAFAHAASSNGDCAWQLVALVRSAVALAVSAALVWASGRKPAIFRPASLWLRSIAGSISLICTFYALSRMHIGDVLTVTNTFPVWVAILSWPLLGERPGMSVWVSLVLGISGVYLVMEPRFDEGGLPILASGVSSVCSAVAMIGLHRLHGLDTRAVVSHFSAVASIVCLGALALAPDPQHWQVLADRRVLSMLLGMGLAATAGQFLLTKAFTAGPPAKVSVVALTQVGFGLLFDYLFWSREIGWQTLTGATLVAAPTAWLVLRSGRLLGASPE